MPNEFEKIGLDEKDRLVIRLLEEINEKLAVLIDIMAGQGRIRPG